MKNTISILLAIAAFIAFGYVCGYVAYELNSDDEMVIIIFVTVGSLAAWGVYSSIQLLTREKVRAAISKTSHSIRETKQFVQSGLSEEGALDSYAQAEQEVESKTYDKGLWSKALIEADGDESKRKIVYMKLRAKQLEGARKASVNTLKDNPQ